MRTSWKKRVAELLLWVAVAIGTALLLVFVANDMLPSNF